MQYTEKLLVPQFRYELSQAVSMAASITKMISAQPMLGCQPRTRAPCSVPAELACSAGGRRKLARQAAPILYSWLQMKRRRSR
jgi:hypothetical protein